MHRPVLKALWWPDLPDAAPGQLPSDAGGHPQGPVVGECAKVVGEPGLPSVEADPWILPVHCAPHAASRRGSAAESHDHAIRSTSTVGRTTKPADQQAR